MDARATTGVVVCVLVVLLLVVMGMQLGWRGGNGRRAQGDPLVACDETGCTVKVLATRGDDKPYIFMPSVRPSFATYNPSATVVRSLYGEDVLVSTTRVSNYTYCPGAHVLDLLDTTQDHVIVTLNDAPRRLRIPWADALWPSGASTVGVQDARPFELKPGYLGLACSLKRPQDGNVFRMCLVVVPLGAVDDVASTITPTALVLLEPRGSAPEKNWLPWVHRGRVYLVQHVAPQRVVSLDLEDVVSAAGVTALSVRVELEQEALTVLRAGVDPPYTWRGSTPLVPFADGLLAVVHRRSKGPVYDHAFALFDATPPFRLATLSRPFRLRFAATRFTFVSGLVPAPDAPAQLVVAFGADDCYMEYVRFRAEDVHALLRDGPLAPIVPIPCDAARARLVDLDAALADAE